MIGCPQWTQTAALALSLLKHCTLSRRHPGVCLGSRCVSAIPSPSFCFPNQDPGECPAPCHAGRVCPGSAMVPHPHVVPHPLLFSAREGGGYSKGPAVKRGQQPERDEKKERISLCPTSDAITITYQDVRKE